MKLSVKTIVKIGVPILLTGMAIVKKDYFIGRIKKMSSLNKIKKNSEQFALKSFYEKMTPDQYQKSISYAVNNVRRDLTKEYEDKIRKLEIEYNTNLINNRDIVIDIISTELIYEIANQMGYWDLGDSEEDLYFKESAKIRIKEIYDNTMKAIYNYAEMKSDSKANKMFSNRKKKVNEEFEIKLKKEA